MATLVLYEQKYEIILYRPSNTCGHLWFSIKMKNKNSSHFNALCPEYLSTNFEKKICIGSNSYYSNITGNLREIYTLELIIT
jgi:hypothetical protein